MTHCPMEIAYWWIMTSHAPIPVLDMIQIGSKNVCARSYMVLSLSVRVTERVGRCVSLKILVIHTHM